MRSDQTSKPPTLADLMGKTGLLLMFSRSVDASSSKMLARIAVARKILTILNATLGDKNNGNSLDTQHSCGGHVLRGESALPVAGRPIIRRCVGQSYISHDAAYLTDTIS